MGNLGVLEILVIALVALLVFGPNKLPEMARSLGKALRTFQAETEKATTVLRKAVEEDTSGRPGVIDRPDEMPAASAAPVEFRPSPVTPPARPEAPHVPAPAVVVADPAQLPAGRAFEDT